MELYPADLNNIIKTQHLSDEHIVLLVYQLLRGLKVTIAAAFVSMEKYCQRVEKHSLRV